MADPLTCLHPNAVTAKFGNGDVYHCPDCSTFIKPTPVVPVKDAGRTTAIGAMVYGILAYCALLALGSFALFQVAAPYAVDHQPNPRPQCSVADCMVSP